MWLEIVGMNFSIKVPCKLKLTSKGYLCSLRKWCIMWQLKLVFSTPMSEKSSLNNLEHKWPLVRLSYLPLTVHWKVNDVMFACSYFFSLITQRQNILDALLSHWDWWPHYKLISRIISALINWDNTALVTTHWSTNL